MGKCEAAHDSILIIVTSLGVYKSPTSLGLIQDLLLLRGLSLS